MRAIMPLVKNQIISVLNDLIETCRDGDQGFKDAADDIKDIDTEKTLLQFSRQRNNFAHELEKIVLSLGGEVEFSGSFLGVLHRRWMDVKYAIAGSDPTSILIECIRGEKAALGHYEDALSKGLPEDIYPTVKRQFSEVQAAYEQLIAFKDTVLLASYKTRKSEQ